MALASGTADAPELPEVFLRVPLAHRGLHDVRQGIAENSVRAAQAAIAAGYGIELDVQLSKDGTAVVFHDYDLARLTSRRGLVKDHASTELESIALKRGQNDTIPSLRSFLRFVGGRAPLLIELKDQSGCFGPEHGTLAASVAAALSGYSGHVAVMSFNPHTVAHLARCAPDVPRGLTTKRFSANRTVGRTAARDLTAISKFDEVGARFISHDRRSLNSPPVLALRNSGVPVLTWTITSPRQEAAARRIAQNITFEGYLAPKPKPLP